MDSGQAARGAVWRCHEVPDGGGLTAAERARREKVRLEAAELRTPPAWCAFPVRATTFRDRPRPRFPCRQGLCAPDQAQPARRLTPHPELDDLGSHIPPQIIDYLARGIGDPFSIAHLLATVCRRCWRIGLRG
jgi:hypothetical protein